MPEEGSNLLWEVRWSPAQKGTVTTGSLLIGISGISLNYFILTLCLSILKDLGSKFTRSI